MSLALAVLSGLREFLAPVEFEPGAKVLVVDGWGLGAVTNSITPIASRYSRIITVGTPFDPLSSLREYGTSADVMAIRLERAGVAPDKLEVVRLPRMERHRTAHAALAVARHLEQTAPGALDLVTLSTHGRRSHNIYSEALAPWRVGILSVRDLSFAKPWWQTSSGVRSVISELLAWGYALIVSNEVEEARREWREMTPQEKAWDLDDPTRNTAHRTQR